MWCKWRPSVDWMVYLSTRCIIATAVEFQTRLQLELISLQSDKLVQNYFPLNFISSGWFFIKQWSVVDQWFAFHSVYCTGMYFRLFNVVVRHLQIRSVVACNCIVVVLWVNDRGSNACFILRLYLMKWRWRRLTVLSRAAMYQYPVEVDAFVCHHWMLLTSHSSVSLCWKELETSASVSGLLLV